MSLPFPKEVCVSPEVKSFRDLITEVQKPGFCGRCGGCVSFCSADNLGALKVDQKGMPVFADEEKCLRCGICYMICPNTNELDEELKEKLGWKPSIGLVRDCTSAKTTDSGVAERCTDGGVVTSLLLYLLDKRMIDAALVSKSTSLFRRTPVLATTREDVISSAGSHFDESFQVIELGSRYSTYSAAMYALKTLRQGSIDRVAMVGTPCQIKTVRKMQTLGVVPADVIKYCLGLFCMENLDFDGLQLRAFEEKYGFDLTQARRVNVKEAFSISLKDGRVIHLPFREVEAIARPACLVCTDFSAEYSDISFGGLGSQEGYTTVLIRSDTGNAIYRGALVDGYITEKKFSSAGRNRRDRARIHDTVVRFSVEKRERAMRNRLTSQPDFSNGAAAIQ